MHPAVQNHNGRRGESQELSRLGAVEKAVEKAHSEYEQFRIEQDKKYISDLDLEISKLKK